MTVKSEQKAVGPSFEEYLNILGNQIPEELIPQFNLSRIREISRELPLVSFAAFECWLGENPPRTDINISFSGVLQENTLLVNWIAAQKHKLNTNKNTVYSKYSDFCEKWSKPDFYLISFINQFWLVYDFPQKQTEILPWYYLSFMENSLTRNPGIKSEIVLQILKLFKEDRIVQDYKKTWKPFIEQIPESVILNTIGVQTNRSIDYLRIYFSIYSFNEVLELLESNNWPGDIRDLSSQLQDLTSECTLFGLSVDCDPALQAKISIELWFTQGSEGKKQALRNLSKKLVRLGLLSRAEEAAFIEWEGEFYLENKHEFWSWPIDYSVQLRKRKILIKKMYYFKIVYIPGEKIRAKGYLCFDRPVMARQ